MRSGDASGDVEFSTTTIQAETAAGGDVLCWRHGQHPTNVRLRLRSLHHFNRGY